MTDTTQPAEPEDVDELSEEEQEELLKELERKRSLRGVASIAVTIIALAFSTYQMWLAARGFEFNVTLPFVGEVGFGQLQSLQLNAIHVVFALVIAFLLFPPSTGDGFVSGRLARLHAWVGESAGENSAIAGVADRVASFLYWFMGDRNIDRITPYDLVLVLLAVLAGHYYLTNFEEILNLRAVGLASGRTLGEVYTFLAPLDALPVIGTESWAYLLGIIAVSLVLEATRRALGFYLMAIVGFFIVYAKFGWLIAPNTPVIGVLSITDTSWGLIIRNLWYTDQGILGVPVRVSLEFIYIFILFGAFLETSGAGQWFIDLAYSVTGKRKGGPAKASILASGFMGTISGSSIANTVTTGAFTIPLMKRSGYRPEFAGAVEASASSGGQILPPVMGAAAFLIVEYTLTPYPDVIIAAAIPAIVFFFGVWVMVHLEASRLDIGGVEGVDLVNVGDHMKRGWFYLLPLGLLLYYLIIERLSVARSAWFTLLAIMALIVVVAAYNERTRVPLIGSIAGLFALQFGAYLFTGTGIVGAALGETGPAVGVVEALFAAGGSLGIIMLGVGVATLLARPNIEAPLLEYDDQVDDAAETAGRVLNRERLMTNSAARYFTFILKAMDGGARTATTVVVAVAAAGIIPGVIATSGLGPNLTALILNVAGTSFVLLLIITAISCIILGMGMPTTVTYIILVSMLGPAMTSFGIPILAAHLFILYFGVIADITPPVAVAAYAASGVAKSDPFETGVEAFSLSLNKAIVPFAFVLSPGILLIRGVGTGEEVHVIGLADVLDLGFFIPEVVLPIIAVFIGVVGLGATVIGYLYTDVSRTNRALFALSALLLMAPGMLTDVVDTIANTGELGTVQLALRGVGLAMFVLLVVSNRRAAGPRAEGVSATSDTTA
ncbi:TRAP transporter fused permease subunit [Haladaptatus sp. DJG-WS-42]|uniref:TRAP transporter permease n=1 Tax=Haladaptatus sp. DJG-WS-42 TaxID=3120516 RepID=UPI0030D21D7D